MLSNIPTPEEMKYFELCFVQMTKKPEGFFELYIKEHPNSKLNKRFVHASSFGCMQEAINWLRTMRRIH